MEKLANKAANKIGASLGSDEEKIAVMAYGLTAIIQLSIIFIFSLAVGLIFKCLVETMIIFFSVGFLRRTIGGTHSSSFNGCLIISILCIALFSLFSRYIVFAYVDTIYTIICLTAIYLFAYINVYRLAPVDSPNKRIKGENRIKKLRRMAFIILTIYMLFSVALITLQLCFGHYYKSYAISLSLAVLWQVCMLTNIGAAIIGKIDRLFKCG
ncbi:MAG: accessory gene regulator B family protein [Oscillospiraceae bacterium]